MAGCPGCDHVDPPHAGACSERRRTEPCRVFESKLRDVICGKHRRIERLRAALAEIAAGKRLLDPQSYARVALAEDGGPVE